MLKLQFTKHAKYQLSYRNISRKNIVKTISKPDRVIEQSAVRKKALKIVKKGAKMYVMVVVYEQSGNTAAVITAFLTSKLKKYL